MGLPQRVAVYTPAEYLHLERAATYRSEYFRGEIFAIAGGSPQHSRIKTNVISQLNSRLKVHPCTTYDSDLRFFEKSRYKWRRHRSIVRFILLAFDHWRKTQTNTTDSRPNRSSRDATHSRLNRQPA